MQPMYYIGLDVHKKKISYCVKDGRSLRLEAFAQSQPHDESASFKDVKEKTSMHGDQKYGDCREIQKLVASSPRTRAANPRTNPPTKSIA